MPTENLMAIMAYFRKEDTEEQSKYEASRIKEIIKIKILTNQIKNRKMIEKNLKQSWFLEEIYKVAKPVTSLTK